MKKKILLPLLLVGCSLALTSCNYIHSLFNDDDMEIVNNYNPSTPSEEIPANAVIAGGVVARDNSAVSNAYCFKNIHYGENGVITNSYKTGVYAEYDVNSGQDYQANGDINNFDLYVPKNLVKNNKHTVILFIHGGAWVSGFKSDVNPYVYEFANRGYITATIKYTLLSKDMNNRSLSIFRDLDEIDACIKAIKSALNDLDFDTTKTNLVIGGASSGSHLAMLYSYSRGQNSSIPISFVVNAVGPVDIKPDSWKAFNSPTDEALDGRLTSSSIATQESNGNITELRVAGEEYNWNEYQTMRIANGMCGIPNTLEDVEASTDSSKTSITNPNAASTLMTKVGGGEDLLSVTYWINNSTNNYKMVCAYAGKDSIVGIGQYARLQTALEAKGIEHEYFYFRNSNHTEISEKADATAYNGFVNQVDSWCETI